MRVDSTATVNQFQCVRIVTKEEKLHVVNHSLIFAQVLNTIRNEADWCAIVRDLVFSFSFSSAAELTEYTGTLALLERHSHTHANYDFIYDLGAVRLFH